MMETSSNKSIDAAVRHALGWLAFGNAVGLYLALLLMEPRLQAGIWTYGRWVPVHLNAQLYGWTALPLVADCSSSGVLTSLINGVAMG